MPAPVKIPETAQAPFRDDGHGTTQLDPVSYAALRSFQGDEPSGLAGRSLRTFPTS